MICGDQLENVITKRDIVQATDRRIGQCSDIILVEQVIGAQFEDRIDSWQLVANLCINNLVGWNITVGKVTFIIKS